MSVYAYTAIFVLFHLPCDSPALAEKRAIEEEGEDGTTKAAVEVNNVAIVRKKKVERNIILLI